MLVRAGSVMSTATCSSARAASTDARSFHSTARVVAAGSTAGPTLPGSRRPCGRRGRAPRRSRRRCRGSCRRSRPRAGGRSPGGRGGAPSGWRRWPRARRTSGAARSARVSSPATHAASSVGSMAVMPPRSSSSVSHGRHGGGRRVTRHRTGVAEREVDVGVPVEVGDAAARRLGEEDREAAGPLGHPGHRHAADQVGGGGGRRGGRPGASGREGGALAHQQLLQP